jgi:hypothetical protein
MNIANNAKTKGTKFPIDKEKYNRRIFLMGSQNRDFIEARWARKRTNWQILCAVAFLLGIICGCFIKGN